MTHRHGVNFNLLTGKKSQTAFDMARDSVCALIEDAGYVVKFAALGVKDFFVNDVRNFFANDVRNFFVHDVKDFFVNIYNGIKQALTHVWEWMQSAFYTVRDFVGKTADQISQTEAYEKTSAFVKHQAPFLIGAAVVIPYLVAKQAIISKIDMAIVSSWEWYRNALISNLNLADSTELLQHMQNQASTAIKITLGVAITMAVGFLSAAVIREVLDNNKQAATAIA